MHYISYAHNHRKYTGNSNTTDSGEATDRSEVEWKFKMLITKKKKKKQCEYPHRDL